MSRRMEYKRKVREREREREMSSITPTLDAVKVALSSIVTPNNVYTMTTKSTMKALKLHFGLKRRRVLAPIRAAVKEMAKERARQLIEGSNATDALAARAPQNDSDDDDDAIALLLPVPVCPSLQLQQDPPQFSSTDPPPPPPPLVTPTTMTMTTTTVAAPPDLSDEARVLSCLHQAYQQQPDSAWMTPAKIAILASFAGGKSQANRALYRLQSAKLVTHRSDGPNKSKPKWRIVC